MILHQRFRLKPETLFIAVNIIDRTLMKMPVARTQLQLVGVSAMLIAWKYQEIYPPSLNEVVQITETPFGVNEVIQMETHLLQILDFSFTFPTPMSFVETFMQALQVTDLPTELYTRFLLEMSLLDLKM